MSVEGGSPLPEWLGDFRVAEFLRKGSMAEVYKGFSRDGRAVAIKVLGAELKDDPDAVARVAREAETLKRIYHPNVAELLEFGRTPDERPYLVFEFIEGATLKAIIERREQPDVLKGLDWMEEAAEALGEAWLQHIIHRDIKPENLMITEEGTVKVVDFGLSKAVFTDEAISPGKSLLGTPRYMSPEMILGQSLDLRSDMYSLGATFFHYFTGESPFDADTHEEMMKRHAAEPPPPPHAIEPSLPEDVCYILMRLMAKDPADRYESYDDLIDHIRKTRLALMSREGIYGGASYAPTEEPEEQRAAQAGETLDRPELLTQADLDAEKARRRRAEEIEIVEKPGGTRWVSGVITLVGLALVVGGIYYTYQGSRSNRSGNSMARSAIDRVLEFFGAPTQSPAQAGRQQWEGQDLEKIEANKDRMYDLMSIIMNYRDEKGHFPGSINELVAEGEIRPAERLDVWGTEFVFIPSAGTLYSYGADGVQFTPDDFEINTRMDFTSLPRQPVGG